MLFQFVHVLKTPGDINEHIRPYMFRGKGPDFLCVLPLPIKLINESLTSNFRIERRADFSGFNQVLKVLIEGLGAAVKAVVFIWGFCHRIYT